jgi:hypothetical protein
MEHVLHPKAQALLDAQVAYIMQRLNVSDLAITLQQEIDIILTNAPLLTLNECVTSDMIKETVHGYAIELDLGAGVFDIIGDIARIIHGHNVHQKTTLNDIVPDKHIEQILDKVLELTDVREYVLHEAVINPVYAALVSDVMYYGLRDYLLQQIAGGKKNVARAGKLLSWGKNLINSVPPELEGMIELNLRQYIQKSISSVLVESKSFLTHIDIQKLRDNLLDIWDDIKQHPVSTYQQLLTSLDVEEFIVLSYEFWRDFRQSDYFKVLIDAGIDAFFNRYGTTTFDVLLDEVGIKREMLIADALRFVPPVLSIMQQKSLLEPLIRQHLEPFYQSDAVQQILGS